VQFADGSDVKSYHVTKQAAVERMDGNLPDPASERWQAGTMSTGSNLHIDCGDSSPLSARALARSRIAEAISGKAGDESPHSKRIHTR